MRYRSTNVTNNMHCNKRFAHMVDSSGSNGGLQMWKYPCSFRLMADKLLNCRLSFVLTIIESTVQFITPFGLETLGRRNMRVEMFFTVRPESKKKEDRSTEL